VARNHLVDLDRREPRQRPLPALRVHVGRAQERHDAVDGDVAGEKDAVLRQQDDEIAFRVRGTETVDLDAAGERPD
jgi:hypothetical protein